MDDYRLRKLERTRQYKENLGFKRRRCTAYNGSGRYDVSGSPPCGCCNGTGRERFRPSTETTP